MYLCIHRVLNLKVYYQSSDKILLEIIYNHLGRKTKKMFNNKHIGSPNLLWSIITNRCPHCHRGDLFENPNPYNLKTTMRMPKSCNVCGQKFVLETGFYFGTGYVSYGITALFTAFTFFFSCLLMGLSLKNNTIWNWLIINTVMLILLQPVIQRLSRSIWLSFFVKYDNDWNTHK